MRGRPLGLVLLTLVAGCHSLRLKLPLDALPADGSPRTQYQVWSGGRSQLLIALRVTDDSVTGIPYWKSPECDSCRVGMERTAVDSIRGPGFDPNKTLVLGLILAPIIILTYGLRGMGDPNY